MPLFVLLWELSVLLWELSVLIWELFGRFYGRKAHLPGLAPFLVILRVSRAFRIILEFRAAEEGWKHFQKKIESFETFSKRSKAGKGTK